MSESPAFRRREVLDHGDLPEGRVAIAPGESTMRIPVLLTVAVFVLVYGLVSRRLDGTPITAPILALAFGLLVGPYAFDIVELEMDGETLQYVAEITLAMVLFHDAARIDLRALRSNARTPIRLLGAGLPMTVLLGFLLGLVFLPGLLPWEVALLAALLAPTDAALGQAVITQESVPARVRQSLNVESGLNDGLIVPLVAVLMGHRRDTVLFIGWFGPRGLASLVFAITVAGRTDILGGHAVAGAAVWTILLSVLLHGATASWLARRYGARDARDDEADVHEFPAPRARPAGPTT